MDWFILSILCALALAGADALTKHWLAQRSAAELVIVRFSMAGLLLMPWVYVHPPTVAALPFWGWVGSALPLEVLAMGIYVIAIRESPLALTLPYLAFTPVFTELFGWLLLGEQVSRLGLLGVLLVTCGAYALNLEHARLLQPRTWVTPFAAIARERGSRLMLGVALIYGVTSVLGKGAMQYMAGLQFGAFYFLLLGAFTLLVFGVREPSAIRILWRPTWKVIIIGALMAVMVVLHFLALEKVQTAYMISVKRSSILFGILFGAALFGDKRLWLHLAAAAVMVGGVTLIALQSIK